MTDPREVLAQSLRDTGGAHPGEELDPEERVQKQIVALHAAGYAIVSVEPTSQTVNAVAALWDEPKHSSVHEICRVCIQAQAAAPTAARSPAMTIECQVRWCRSGQPATVPVTENIDDGAFRAVICQPCASAIGVRPGDDLPEPEVCRARVETARERKFGKLQKFMQSGPIT